MGLTENQLLWRVELPLALPEILAGLRIAITTTVGLATLAFFAGAGGLGEQIYAEQPSHFKSNVVVAGGLACCWPRVLRPAHPDRPAAALTPWRRAAATERSRLAQRRSGDFGDAVRRSSLHERESVWAAACRSAGPDELLGLRSSHLRSASRRWPSRCASRSRSASASATRAGASSWRSRLQRRPRRAPLVLLVFFVAYLGIGLQQRHRSCSRCSRIPPILTNTYVGITPGGPRDRGRRARHGHERAADRPPGRAAAGHAHDLRAASARPP